MDILKRELAPIPLEAWAEIDAQATRSLKAMLSGRKFLDVTGPMGTNFPGVPEGRLVYPEKQPEKGLAYGIRKVHHIVEVRVPFELDIEEMDNVVRGARDVDLSRAADRAVRGESDLSRAFRGQHPRAQVLRGRGMPHHRLETGKSSRRHRRRGYGLRRSLH